MYVPRVMSLSEASICNVRAAPLQTPSLPGCARTTSPSISIPPARTKGLGDDAGKTRRRARSWVSTCKGLRLGLNTTP